MKPGIHPSWYPDAIVTCACGNTWTTGSTKKEIHTDVCNKCHPFFTGEQRIVDTAGQVERFMKRISAKEQIAATQPAPEEKKAKKEKRREKGTTVSIQPVPEAPAELPLAVAEENPAVEKLVAKVEATKPIEKAPKHVHVAKVGEPTPAKVEERAAVEIPVIEVKAEETAPVKVEEPAPVAKLEPAPVAVELPAVKATVEEVVASAPVARVEEVAPIVAEPVAEAPVEVVVVEEAKVEKKAKPRAKAVAKKTAAKKPAAKAAAKPKAVAKKAAPAKAKKPSAAKKAKK